MISTLLLMLQAADPPADSTDLWARAIGTAGLVIALWTAAQSGRDAYWKRRAKVAPELRGIVTDILNRLSGTSQAGGLELLWTPKTQSDTDAIGPIAARTPDRYLRNLLLQFEGEVLRARGSIQPDSDNPEPLLGDAQLTRVEKARTSGRRIVARLDKIERKAV